MIPQGWRSDAREDAQLGRVAVIGAGTMGRGSRRAALAGRDNPRRDAAAPRRHSSAAGASEGVELGR